MQQSSLSEPGLELIESMINRARNEFNENGSLYLVWGIAVFISALVQFILIEVYPVKGSYYTWGLLFFVLVYQFVYLSKQEKSARVRTYTADILGYTWMIFMCCLGVTIFILIYSRSFLLITPMSLVLYAFPTFISGYTLKFRPLQAGGIFCFPLAIGSLWVSYGYQYLFLCAAVLVAWIIPGLILRNNYKNKL